MENTAGLSRWIRAAKSSLALSLLLAASSVLAADPLFEEDSTLAITLEGPFKQINRERDKEAEYPGKLSYVDDAGESVEFDAKLSVRGKFRLRKDICSNAQLWVDLKKGQVKGSLFTQQNKLKLLVQCRDNKRYAEYLAREHQAYLMFAEVSDISFDTRMLEVTYRDSDTGEEKTQPGMFIQHHKRLAEERGMTVVDTPGAELARLDEQQSARVALFSYLVANTDYSMIAAAPGENCCHNIKVLEAPDGQLYPVPYDFDSTGFVSAPYAEPSAGIGQRSVKQRLYRGYCVSDAAQNIALQTLRENRERFTAIISDDPLATKKGIKRAGKFIEDFYELVDDPRKLQEKVYDECR